MEFRRVILLNIFIFLIVNILEAQEDTFNRVNKDMKKTGLWIYYYDTLHLVKFSEGEYVDGQKQGCWIEYYRNGNKKSEITYLNNVPSGLAKLYYENGNPSEQGTWNSFGWVGEYKMFYRSGRIARELNYDENTLRSGMQKYYSESGHVTMAGYWENGMAKGLVTEYYDSGRLRAESQWMAGRLSGITKEYYETGSLKAEIVYNNGVYDVAASRTFKNRQDGHNIAAVDKPAEKPSVTKPEQPKEDKESPSYAVFRGTGYHKMYDPDTKRIEKEGNFIDGVLDEGKRYYYNSKGELIKTAIYEHGKIVKIIDK